MNMLHLLSYDFIQNAIIAGTIVAIVTAIVGYFVVLRSQAFASDSLSHISFAGATGGPLLGLSSLVGMLLLTVLSAVGLGALGERARGRDVETGMVLAFALGLGVLFTNLYATSNNASVTISVLFGSILSVSHSDVITTFIIGLFVLCALALLSRPLLFASIDPEVAQARGVSVRLLSVLFLTLLAITIAISIQIVGALLVFALLIAPAATAMRWTQRPLTAIVLAVLLGLIFTWSGLLLSFISTWHYLPVSFYIATLAALSYFVSLYARRDRFIAFTSIPKTVHRCDNTH